MRRKVLRGSRDALAAEGVHVERRGTVLIVEGDPGVRRAISGWLGGIARVVAAVSYAEALRAVDDVTRFDAFVVSASLVDRGGLEVVARLRDRGARAPALVMAERPDEEDMNRAFDLGARYSVVPWVPRRVIGFVRAALGSPVKRVAERVAAWRAEYGLTVAEAEILFAATYGETVENVAARRGIAASTMKRHVHNALGKTGDASLLDAVTRLLRGVGLR
jgi:DNA-binding NarL/FixJ family response regulator